MAFESARCLVEWLRDDSDSSSEDSSVDAVENHDHKVAPEALASAVPLGLDDGSSREEGIVIVISSGEESSDVENDEVLGPACEDDAIAAGPEIIHNNEIKPPPDSTSPRHAVQPAEREPAEIYGIFAAAIEELQHEDDAAILNSYEALAFVEQQEERNRQPSLLDATSRRGDDPTAQEKDRSCEALLNATAHTACRTGVHQAITLQRVDSAFDEVGSVDSHQHEIGHHSEEIAQAEAQSMSTTLNCRSLEQAELDRSRAAMANASGARVEQAEVRPVSEKKLPYKRQKPWAQLEGTVKEREMMASIQQATEGTGVLDAGNAAQVRRGVRAQDKHKDKVKSGRIKKVMKDRLKALTSQPDLSGRQQLLNLRSQLAEGEDLGERENAPRTTDSSGKTKLARRNKQRRRNRVNQKRAAESGA
ncbi:hypothetical protein Slin14017_G027000 [Septoria linicola]|nr:hypothetical protein Slin14017_G027000 [Septoria linicola]